MKRLSILPDLSLVALLLVACGCTVGPNYSLPKSAVLNAPFAHASLPDVDGQHIAQEQVPSDWWHLYDDPLLEQLVSDALNSNTDLRVAAANLARYQEALRVAEAQGGFSGSASAAFERAQESGEQYLIFSKVPVANEGDVGIKISYEFDLFGKLRRGVEAANADGEATQAAEDLTRITVVADVVRAYIENCLAAEQLAIAEQSLALQRQRVDVSRRLRNAGRGNRPDVTNGQTQLQSLAAEIPSYTGRRKMAQYQLAMLLARAPSDLPPAVLTCNAVPQIKQALPVGDGATLLMRRPDVREAERQLAASTARVGVATGALYPTVIFGASAGTTGVLEDLGMLSTNHWSFGPLISWTFPTNGARGRVHEAEDTSTAALAHFDGVVLNALRETETTLATYVADYTRAEALRAALKSATESADETHRSYVGGRQSFISDLDATRTLTGTRAQVAASEGQVAIDQANLFLALGGGWEREREREYSVDSSGPAIVHPEQRGPN
ncbi:MULTISPECIES: efflux transporter outer membrane subunit [Burkholderiaceae]|uniref:Outer membrane component of tripartite multidrug resistance system n=1 Tax=Caballeronia sordidicola TaxID=196367 RepID=A0A242M7K6_CABSO|nr:MULTISPECIES: efflux transporter outer membrane subunit [Burkholderiaceae]AME27117.1 RND transporter [Burkholderia sp. PAMC 26561]AME27738.1 RND transporter [Burkholderia sp. PAMC 26561]OTP67247.1 Outer membrane component of tripartite multidrug resistance system [Caballeronia sordidicola]